MSKDREKNDHGDGADERARGRLPGLPPELKNVYDTMCTLGATNPAAGKPVERLAKEMHLGKNKVLVALHTLEGKGIVGHHTTGRDETWYTRK
ncbi:MAG: helix-turn-helix domain-containing protein [Euryarchaeota archaeon]|nr:helix-turn-helix domain-containing protein [Euryarchaeota archaeon]